MTSEKKKDFTRRISQANKTDLVVVTFDIIIENIDCASKCLEEGDVNGYRTELKSAQRFLGELMRSLDFKYPISKNLLSIYEYVQKKLIACDISGEDRGLDEARGILSRIGEAFSQIAGQDNSESVMENAQQIYAGLTYGKGTLNEADMGIGTNRGFLA
ncbi:MAG: flagellar protein FliS [Lachnospiraceae bacterium]|nr:flagellar protein FliS [Lachnospiraceae bacterium]